jgi:hypothetical protein
VWTSVVWNRVYWCACACLAGRSSSWLTLIFKERKSRKKIFFSRYFLLKMAIKFWILFEILVYQLIFSGFSFYKSNLNFLLFLRADHYFCGLK